MSKEAISSLSSLSGVQGLPFFTLAHASLNLKAVAALVHIVANCIVEINEPDRIVLQAAEAAVKVTVIAAARAGDKLLFNVAVAVAGSKYAAFNGLAVHGNTYCAAAAVCGTIYRKAILLVPPQTPSNWKGLHVVTHAWPPVRIVGLAVALFMETLNTAFATAEVTPRSLANSIVKFMPAAVYLHIEYKARSVSIVIQRSSQHKACHTISLPNNLVYTQASDETSFCWKNAVGSDGTQAIPKHVNHLWSFLGSNF